MFSINGRSGILMASIAVAVGLLLFVAVPAAYLKMPKIVPESAELKVVEEDPPVFVKINDITERKEAFFSFLRPLVREENEKILRDRERLVALYEKHVARYRLNRQELVWLEKLSRQYHVTPEFKDEKKWLRLMRRVDIVPEDLALVQAAVESNWGTSRFAVEGRNYFGEWCFGEDCGLVPKKREKGKTHKVEVFASVRDSVKSYLNNLNTHRAYREFRAKRHSLRQQDKALEGNVLVPGLVLYSERGLDYVQQIRSMMEQNKVYLEG